MDTDEHRYETRVLSVIRSFVAVMSVVASLAQPLAMQTNPLSVCELIARRAEYNGRMVAVRGEASGGGHGAWLVVGSDCQYKLVTRGVAWPNVIYLSYPSNKSPDKDDHADFRVDWGSIRKAEQAVKRSRFNPETDHATQTCIGLFVTYSDLENRVSPGVPGAQRLGFGPVGLGAPAQLLIKSIKNVVVVHGPLR